MGEILFLIFISALYIWLRPLLFKNWMKFWVFFINADTPPAPGAPPHSQATLILVGIVKLFALTFLGVLGGAFLLATLYAISGGRAFDSNGYVALFVLFCPILIAFGMGVIRLIKSVSER